MSEWSVVCCCRRLLLAVDAVRVVTGGCLYGGLSQRVLAPDSETQTRLQADNDIDDASCMMEQSGDGWGGGDECVLTL